MDIIEWNEKLSLGNDEIDEQHKELINLINHVAMLIKRGDYDFLDIFHVVSKLDDYITMHLDYEEVLMDKNSFPGKEEHIKEHDFARKKISEINIAEKENFKEKFLMDTLGWLVRWLLKHIMDTDKKLETYL